MTHRPRLYANRTACLHAVACLAALCPLASDAQSQSITKLEADFNNPPAAARPWVFWYWLHGRVSDAGITADLEAMRQAGLGGAYLMPIKGPTDPPEFEPLATSLSPRFWRLVRHAAREADRLGLELGMHVCDGFATAGGPWITPKMSMQKLVWSKQVVEGDRLVDTQITQPESYRDYYEDIATLALPLPEGYGISTETTVPRVTTSDGEADAVRLASSANDRRYRSSEPSWIEYAFADPFTARSVTVTPDGSNYQCQRFTVEASDDGERWRAIAKLQAPRHGWQEEGRPVTHALPKTTANRFRFVWDPDGSEPGAEDLDTAKWAPVLKVQSIVMSSEARLHQHRGKGGAVWRIGQATTDEQVPKEHCTPSDKVRDITESMDASGRLSWEAPPGRWLILRFGHTSTGRHNETAGGGRGLECDKMNVDAVRLQFDRWFGEAQRQITGEIGGEAASRVLSTLHVDSWECGAQNWARDLPAQYRRMHGGDLIGWLPTMAGLPIESATESEHALKRVRQTLADLFVTRFYGTLREIADDRGLRFTGECTAPTMPGDSTRHFAYLDAPMGEFWLQSPTHDKPNDMHDAISGAHVYGRNLVQAEAFTQLRIRWDETPATLKSLGDLHLAMGANRLVMHVWTHNPWLDRKPGQTLGGVGLYFQRDQPWVSTARGWTDYLARCHAVLQAGRPVVDIAVCTDDDIPRRALTPEKLVDSLPGLIGKRGLASERERVANHNQPQHEMPVGVRASANIPSASNWIDPLRGYHYDTIRGDTLTGSTVSGHGVKLKSGMTYAYLHRHGTDSPWTKEDLSSLGVARDFEAFDEVGERAPGVAWAHRTSDSWDAYFVSNQLDEQRDLTLSMRAVRRTVEFWDPLTGQRRLAEGSVTDRTKVTLQLEPLQSIFMVLRDASAMKAYSAPEVIQEIAGPWNLRFSAAVGESPEDRALDELEILNAEESLAGFVGMLEYTMGFHRDSLQDPEARVWLETGPAAAMAEVTLNGAPCGVAWAPPWRVDVTHALQPGENRLEIITPSVWKNALLADSERAESDKLTWTSAKVYLADREPSPLGLRGPVRLLKESPQE